MMELRDSSDRAVADVNARVETVRKWRAKEEVQKMERLQHKQIVGMVQTRRAGLGWSEPPILWSKASKKERKDLVVAEVTRIEQEELRVRSVAQGQQGQRTTWENVANRAISWAEFWKLPQARLSFLIRATYDTLPTRALKTSINGLVQSNPAISVGPSMPHSSMFCRAAKHH